jgi:hypothetical protein
MTPIDQFTSTSFVDAIDRVIQTALDSLFLHEDSLSEIGTKQNDPQTAWSESLKHLQTTVERWQAILDAMGEQVHLAQTDLANLDADLKQSLTTFVTARKHLEMREAASGFSA